MEDEDMEYCKICLVTDCKMFSSPSISEAYSQLVQVILCDYKLYVCYECKHLLIKCEELRSKCMMALNVLSSINTDHSKITKIIVRDIDRKRYKLESKLSHSCMLLVCNSNPILLPDPNIDSNIKTENDSIPDALEDDKSEINIEIDAEDLFSDVKTQDTEYPYEILPSDHNLVSDIKIKTDTNPDDNPEINNFTIYAGDLFSNLEKQGTEYPNKIFQSNHTASRTEIVPETKPDQKCLPNSKKKESVPKKIETLECITKKRNSDLLPVSGKKRTREQMMHNYATIDVMTPSEAKRVMLLRKESRNYKTSPYTCELCYKGFTFESTYNNHMILHSPDSGTVECEFCHLLFRTRHILSKHITECHKYKITCKSCPYSCFSLGQACIHSAIHKGETSTCEQCGMSFRHASSLSNHKRKKHPGCVCTHCGSMFRSLLGMKIHIQKAHKLDSTELLGPKCEECDVQFATETAWKRHLVLSSKHTVINGCEDCGESFLTAKELRCHAKQHPAKHNSAHYAKVARLYIRKFKAAYCKLCDKRLETRTEYEEHMKSEHPNFAENNICEVCGEVFKCDIRLETNAEYEEHMKSEHPKTKAARKIVARQREVGEDNTQYICEVCGKEFKLYISLKYHTYKHTGERPYKCDQCDKKYSQPGPLYKHKVTCHSGAPRFKCDVCQKTFHVKGPLVTHMKMVHLGIRRFQCKICNKSFGQKWEVKSHMDHVHFMIPRPKRVRTKRRNKEDKVTVPESN